MFAVITSPAVNPVVLATVNVTSLPSSIGSPASKVVPAPLPEYVNDP